MKQSHILSDLQTNLSQSSIFKDMIKIQNERILEKYYNIDLKCQKGNNIFLICQNKNCEKVGIMCDNKKCQCYILHKGCPLILYQSSIEYLQSKIFKYQTFQQAINDHIQKAITQLCQLKQKLLLKFSEQCKYIGLSKQQKNFLSYLQKGQSTNITGTLTRQMILDQTSSQKIKKITDDFQNKFKDECKSLQKKIKQVQESTLKNYNNTFGAINNHKGDFVINKVRKQNQQIEWNSKIIKTKEQSKKLQLFFQNKQIKQVKLLFRASQYAFLSSKFHQKCDGKKNTLTIIETEFNKIIGGYTPLIWDQPSSGYYSTDNSGQSFIFSLTNNHKFKLSKKQNTIYNHLIYGPTFGGHDIYISNRSNQNNSSYANICNGYIHGDYKNGDKALWQKFIGSKQNNNFKTKQYQVYEIILN